MTKVFEVRRTFLKCIALIVLIFCVGCQSFFYFPVKEKLFDPAKIRMQPEDVFINTKSGLKIHAWYFAATTKEPSKGTLLFFHGNAENLTSHFLMFHWLPDRGYNFLIFDYPGYGQSEGTPSPRGTVEAGVAAAEWLHKVKDQRPLIIYGHSLGGAVALRTAEEIKASIPLSHIVIEASFSSYRRVARSILNRSWWTWSLQPLTYIVLSDSYAAADLASLSPVPLLFIHGSQDRAIYPQSSQEMFKEAKEPKDLWIVPGGQHGNLYEVNNRELREQFLAYLAQKRDVSK